MKIKLNGVRLIPTNNVKYLGLTIDENLTFKTHIELLNAKLRRANNILAISRHYVPEPNLKQIYYGQFHSHLVYCCQVWGQNLTNISKTITLQKKAIRLMTFADRDAHSSPLFKKMNILKFPDIVSTNNIVFVHKILNQDIPQSLMNYFCEVEENDRSQLIRNVNSICNIPLGSVKTSKPGTIQDSCANDWNQALKKLSNRNSTAYWMKKLSSKNLKSLITENCITSY